MRCPVCSWNSWDLTIDLNRHILIKRSRGQWTSWPWQIVWSSPKLKLEAPVDHFNSKSSMSFLSHWESNYGSLGRYLRLYQQLLIMISTYCYNSWVFELLLHQKANLFYLNLGTELVKRMLIFSSIARKVTTVVILITMLRSVYKALRSFRVSTLSSIA